MPRRSCSSSSDSPSPCRRPLRAGGDDRLARRAARRRARWLAAAAPRRASTSSACTGAGRARCSSGRARRAGAGARGRTRRRRPRTGPTRARPSGPARGGWRLGNPWWVGPSDRIEYRLRGRVSRLRAWFVWSPPPASRADAAEGGRARDRAAQRLERGREDPARRPVVRGRLSGSRRPSHRRRERLHRGAGAGDREGDPALPREGERLERHRLQLPRRPLRHRLRGPLRRDRAQRRRRARGGLQHRLGRRRRARRVQLARGRGEGARRRSRRCSPGGSTSRTSTRRRRSRSSPAATPASAPGLPVFLRTVSGHRDTGFTDCPGTALYNLLNGDRRRGLPARACRSSTRRRHRHRARDGPLPGEALGAAALDGRRLRRGGNAVASSPGAGANVDWTWDATALLPGSYTYAIRSGDDVTPADGADRRRRHLARDRRRSRPTRRRSRRTATRSPTARRSRTR